jgi:hypothetical protein
VKEHIGLVVLEHLGNQLDVHILDVDFLPGELATLLISAWRNGVHLPGGSYSEA